MTLQQNPPSNNTNAAARLYPKQSFLDARNRNTYPHPGTPGERSEHQTSYVEDYSLSDVKETQFAPSYEPNGAYHPNGGTQHAAYRRPSYSNDTILSTFLQNIFTAAKDTLGTSSHSATFGNSSSSTSFSLPATEDGLLNAIRSPTLPSASTVGFVGLCSLWYLTSALSSNTGKAILTRFRYPVTLTFVQFAFVAGYCVVILGVRERIGGMRAGKHASFATAGGWGIKKPSRVMFQGTLMMSLFQIAGHVFSSMAIARVPVSTVHTIKALSPLFTVASYALLFRVRYSASTYLALAPLTLGVMLACSFDLRANAFGFLCALGSTIIFVSQNIFSKKLLPKESSAGTSVPNASTGGGHKLDKLNLLFYSSGMAFLLMIPIWIYSDGSAILNAWANQEAPPSPSHSSSSSQSTSLLVYFILNGSVHFAQNLLAFSILARTSPVTYSIASLVKRIAVICIAIVWSGQHVTGIQGTGMAMTFFGLWLYNRAKGDVAKGEIKRTKVEKRAEMFLPTSAEDLRSLDPTPPPTLPNDDAFSFPPNYTPTVAYAPTPLSHSSIIVSPPTDSAPFAGAHHEAAPPANGNARNRSWSPQPFVPGAPAVLVGGAGGGGQYR